MLIQMRGDPRDRLFNQLELPETYLKLRKHIRVDFEYRINAKLDLEKLKQEMRSKLTKTKEETRIERRKNRYGRPYEEQVTTRKNDYSVQTGYLNRLLKDLDAAGYVVIERGTEGSRVARLDK